MVRPGHFHLPWSSPSAHSFLLHHLICLSIHVPAAFPCGPFNSNSLWTLIASSIFFYLFFGGLLIQIFSIGPWSSQFIIPCYHFILPVSSLTTQHPIKLIGSFSKVNKFDFKLKFQFNFHSTRCFL
jgi:hypothetical protein